MSEFDDIAAKYFGNAARMAEAYSRDAADREDLVQEMLLGIWKALPKFRGDSSEKTFVYRVMQNKALDHLREQYRNPEEPASRESEGVQDNAALLKWREEHPERKMALADALRSLKLPHRQVATLALEGMSYREIADVLGIQEGNVGVRLGRAKKELQRLLGEIAS